MGLLRGLDPPLLPSYTMAGIAKYCPKSFMSHFVLADYFKSSHWCIVPNKHIGVNTFEIWKLKKNVGLFFPLFNKRPVGLFGTLENTI